MKQRRIGKSTLTVAALQSDFADDVDENVERVTALVRQAAEQGAQIALAPELFEGPYFCRVQDARNFARARSVEGHRTVQHFRALARELDLVIPVSFFERVGHAYYNSVAIIDADGSLLGVYRKSHIPDGPGYQEKFYFRPGGTGFKAWQTKHGTVGVGICWDQWFPECARAMVLQGAEVLLYPTAIGSEPEDPQLDTRDPWMRAMIGHAVSNVVPIAAANRVGNEGGQIFYGSSFIADHRGERLAELGRSERGVIIASLDLDQIRRDRASFGFFRDRRPELYGALLTPDGVAGPPAGTSRPSRKRPARSPRRP
ncbi:MAG TPA: N-carbamoylputrescine amidase [Myxococcaceae bacterium]|nr:N-carbamoylputrescine amidase [Myxococcaceae bacterium]